jgi:hypothetical protein
MFWFNVGTWNALTKTVPKRKEGCGMLKERKPWVAGLMIGLIIMMATPAFARSPSLKDAGVALWIFIIIGTVIVLLQLIPAAILFFSFVGTSSNMVFKRKKEGEKAAAEEKAVLTRVEPAPVKK